MSRRECTGGPAKLYKRIPYEWEVNVLINCSITRVMYRGIKLISHTIKLWERVVARRLGSELTFSEQQCGFMPGNSTTDALFALRVLMEKYREGQKEMHCVHLDMEKTHDKCQEKMCGIA